MPQTNVRSFHYGYVIVPVILSIFGLIFAYSTGISAEDGTIGPFFQSQFFRQLVWVIVGLIIAGIILSLDYFQLAEMSEWFYIGGIVALIAVLLFGVRVRGAKSWLGFGSLGIQPSEIMKLCYILFFAKYLSNAPIKEQKTKVILISSALVLLPLGLVMLQPDLGTSIVFVVTYILMIYFGFKENTFTKYVMITGVVMVVLVLSTAYYHFYYLESGGASMKFFDLMLSFETMLIIAVTMFAYSGIAVLINTFRPVEIVKKILPFTIITGISFFVSAVGIKVLKEYQWKRLLVFINPEFDHWGAGYNIIQSKISIGSGGFLGQGIFRGTQNILGFLPEKSTDFVFSILAEEMGFFGASIVIGLFAYYFYLLLKAIQSSKDTTGKLICAGVLAMFFIHFFINVGMALGVAPATGLPLPFISYGGSSYLTFIIGSALVANIYNKRFVHMA